MYTHTKIHKLEHKFLGHFTYIKIHIDLKNIRIHTQFHIKHMQQQNRYK